MVMVDDPVLDKDRSIEVRSRGIVRVECTAEKEKVTYGREFFNEVEYASYFLEIEKIGVFY